MNESYTRVNSRIIDQWVSDGWEWGTPISHEIFEKAKIIARIEIESIRKRNTNAFFG